LQFRIKGQEYFLTFAEEEKQWLLVAPTATGLLRIPVYVDAAKLEHFGVFEKGASNSSH